MLYVLNFSIRYRHMGFYVNPKNCDHRHLGFSENGVTKSVGKVQIIVLMGCKISTRYLDILKQLRDIGL